MFHHPVWAVGSYSSGPPAAGTVGTKSTGGFYQADGSPCISVLCPFQNAPGSRGNWGSNWTVTAILSGLHVTVHLPVSELWFTFCCVFRSVFRGPWEIQAKLPFNKLKCSDMQ